MPEKILSDLKNSNLETFGNGDNSNTSKTTNRSYKKA